MNKVKNSNGLGIASLITFIIGLFIVGLGFLLKYIDGSEYSGWWIVFAIWIGIMPLIASGILALINVINFYSKKSIKKSNKFFLILDWCILILIILPFIILQIYNVVGIMFM